MDAINGTSTSDQVPSVDVEAETELSQCSSIASDDGTETYHSLESEVSVIESDQHEEEDDENPLVASVTAAELVEGAVDRLNEDGSDEFACDSEPPAELTQPMETDEGEQITSFIVDNIDSDDGGYVQEPTVSTHELMNENSNRCGSEEFAYDTEPPIEQTQPMEAVEGEKITSFIVDVPDDDNGEYVHEPVVSTQEIYECSTNIYESECNCNELPEGFEPIESSASSTPDSDNTVRAVITDEAMKNLAITSDVDVGDEPALINPRLERRESPQLQGKFNRGPSVDYLPNNKIINERSVKFESPVSIASTTPDSMSTAEAVLTASKVITTDADIDIELFSSQSKCDNMEEFLANYNGINPIGALTMAKHLQGFPSIFCDEVVKLEPLHMENHEHSKTVFLPGLTQDEIFSTPKEMVHQERSYGSPVLGQRFKENLLRAPDELSGDGISNPGFQCDNVHSITMCEANECHGSEIGSPDGNDLHATRAFQVNDWRNNQVSDTGTDLDEIVIFSRSEHSTEGRKTDGMISCLKTSKVIFGRVEEEPPKETGNTGISQEQPRHTKCATLCLRLKPGTMFIVFTLMFLGFCVIIRTVFDGPAHGHLQHYGSSPAPHVQYQHRANNTFPRL